MSRHAVKEIAEDNRSIDINKFNRSGLCNDGLTTSWVWSRRGEEVARINVISGHETITLSYRCREHGGEWEDILQPISLAYTSCNYGSHRPWFVCPRCQKRVGKLYAGGKRFYCRHCYNLSYQTQRETTAFRLLTKVQKLRDRLGSTANTSEPIGPKPKGMHWKTYYQLKKKAEHCEGIMWGAAAKQLGLTSFC
ncbi:hypothetical protein [Desulfosporosinus nitroreducens]|uniref:Uncharacterized protein n=1 Tax=Desulfosporosinus nitroreducens TaxID=2018668 RepID=A0ABT8QRL5_9FIRM|nr:hypothetical protein [Desulfosporosinus nitroreducens]MDO0823502.1 hypothetical protein [Desulfosporosinus nitroreducens]